MVACIVLHKINDDVMSHVMTTSDERIIIPVAWTILPYNVILSVRNLSVYTYIIIIYGVQ